MATEKEKETVTRVLQERIRTFSRIEKAFYGSMIATAIILAVSIIYMQSYNLRMKQEISQLNSKIAVKQTDYNDARQEVNALTTRDRVTKIANDDGLSNQTGNIRKVD